MDITKMNKLYELINNTVNKKQKTIDRYKDSSSYYSLALHAEINLLNKTISVMVELVEEIKKLKCEKRENAELKREIEKLKKELEVSEELYNNLSEILLKHLESHHT